MVGGTVEKLLKQDFRRLESWKRSGMLEAAEDVLATGTIKTMDINVVSTFGKEVWFACRFVPFQFEDQPHLLALFTDISKRKRVEEELRKSEQQLRNLTAYAQKVAEIERTNIAREIHDELAQTLTVFKMDLTWLKKKLPVGQNPMTEKINTMLKAIDRTIETMKRIATDLRPGILDDLGLAAAIEWQAEEFQKQTGIKCKVVLDAEDITLDRDRNTAIFRIFQETLTNVARHAKATQVTVSLREKEGKIKLTVKDNGKGITKEEIAHPKSYGLMGIGERAKILNGNSIIKGVHGKGTSVTVEIPVHEKKKKESYLLNNTPSTTGVTE
jgi:signal transduction histidine kinase